MYLQSFVNISVTATEVMAVGEVFDCPIAVSSPNKQIAVLTSSLCLTEMHRHVHG